VVLGKLPVRAKVQPPLELSSGESTMAVRFHWGPPDRVPCLDPVQRLQRSTGAPGLGRSPGLESEAGRGCQDLEVSVATEEEVVARGPECGVKLGRADVALHPNGGPHLVAKGVRSQHHLVAKGARGRSEVVHSCQVDSGW
jgi:hypothetical protein